MTLDPDRRRPAPPHPGFKKRRIDVDMEICHWCGALVPADELEFTKHEEWDRRIVSRFLTLFERLPGASPPVTAGDPPVGTTRPPAPATQATSPAGEGGPGGRNDDARPAPTGPNHDPTCAMVTSHHLTCTCGAVTAAHRRANDPEQADLLAYETTLTDQGEP